MLTHEQAALNRAWPMICQMVTALALGIAFFVPGKQAHLRLWRLARVAESLARRWLVLAACEAGEWPQVHVADDCDTDPAKAKSIIAQTHKIPGFNQDHGGEANGAARPSDFTRSSFRLAEAERPYPSAQPRLRTYPPGTGPRLTWLDMPREPDPEPVEANPDNLTQLQRRCAALVSLVSDRERHVQRMARWLATTAARNAAKFSVPSWASI